jgi:hypothetical protein
MQKDAALAGLAHEVRILGVNGIGHDSANATNCAGRTIPWLQDVTAQDVWNDWKVTYRDVIVLDPANKTVSIYNLTTKDLAIPANYNALRDILVGEASKP